MVGDLNYVLALKGQHQLVYTAFHRGGWLHSPFEKQVSESGPDLAASSLESGKQCDVGPYDLH